MSSNWSLKRSLWGAACSAAQPLMLNVLSIPAMAFIIRRLGPVPYGQWTVATTIIAGLGIFTNLGMRGTFVRTIARSPESAATALAEQISVRLLLSVGVLGVAVSICLALGYSHTIIAVAAIAGVGMIVGTLATTAGDLFQAFNQLPTVAYANFCAGLILTIVSVICIWLGAGPIGLSLAYLLGPVAAASLLLRAVRRQHFPVCFTWDVARFFALVKESRFFAFPLGLTAASSYAAAFLLPRLVGVGTFGFFAAGMLVSSRLAIVPDSLSAAFYPAIARLYKRDRELAVRLVIACLIAMAVVCVAVAIAGVISSNWIARILFPSNFMICAHVMRLTFWIIPLMGVENIMGYALYAAGRESAQARAAVLAAACQIVLTVFLTFCYGVEGAAWSVTARYAISAATVLPVFLQTFGGKRKWRPVLPSVGVKGALSNSI